MLEMPAKKQSNLRNKAMLKPEFVSVRKNRIYATTFSTPKELVPLNEYHRFNCHSPGGG